MEEEKYWQIIAESLQEGPYQSWQEHFLIHKLTSLPAGTIKSFHYRTEDLADRACTSGLWCAAFIMNEGCTSDEFRFFCYWLITRGRRVYTEALNNPDSLVALADPLRKNHEFEAFGDIPSQIYQLRTTRFIDDDDPTAGEPSHRLDEVQLTWNEEQPETMRQVCPLLFARCWRL